VTALALVVVTASLAVLLAVLFHLAWPPVLVSVVGTLPALYLAWLAVPGAISQKRPAYGRRAAQWTRVELGVHKVIDAGPMPAYVRRPHDELLRAVLDPGLPASRLVVVSRRVLDMQDRRRLRGGRRPAGGLAAGLPDGSRRAGGAAGGRDPGPHGAVAG
jgi:hypothetical protein